MSVDEFEKKLWIDKKSSASQIYQFPWVAVAERSKAPDWEKRSKVFGSNPQPYQQFFNPRSQKNQLGTLSQGNSNLQWP